MSARVRWLRLAFIAQCACGAPSGAASTPSVAIPGAVPLAPAANESTPRRVRRFVAPTSVQTVIAKTRASFVPIALDGWEPNDRLALDGTGAQSLLVGALGERWLVARDGRMTGARSLADGTLVAARRRATGTFTFVEATGATYFARDALADLEWKRTPSVRFRSAAAGRDALVGVTIDDALVRSLDDGATWSLVPLASPNALPMSITMNARGEGVLETVAGRPWVTMDDGATFAPMTRTDGVAPGAPRLDSKLDIVLRGNVIGRKAYLGAAVLDNVDLKLTRAAAGFALERIASVTPIPFEVPARDQFLPAGELLRYGQAAFTGERFLEVGPRGSPSAGKVRGWIDGVPLRPVSVPGLASCERTRFASSADKLFALCTQLTPGGGPYFDTLFQSTDGGRSWASLGRLPVHVASADGSMFAGPNGSLLIDRRCAGNAPREDCSLVLRLANGHILSARAPSGLDRVLHLRVAPDGTILALATRELAVVLLVSHDGGRRFDERPIPDLELASPHAVEREVEDLTFVEDTKAVVAFVRSKGVLRRYETRDEGLTFQSELAAFPFDAVGLSGRRALATVPREEGVAYESADAGRTWGKVRVPTMGTGELTCRADACLLNGELVRRGWELDGPVALAAPTVLPPPARAVACQAGAPLALDPFGQHWIAVPTPTDEWAAAAKKGDELFLLRMARGASEPTALPFFPRGEKRNALALATREGIVAIGYSRIAGPQRRTDVEVAWFDFATAQVHHATLPAASPPVSWGDAPKWRAWIVPGQGLVVRPREEESERRLFFARTTGAVTEMPLPERFPFSVSSVRRATDRFVFVGAPRGNHMAKVLLIATLPDAGGPMSHVLWPLWPDPVGAGPNVVVTIDGHVIVAPPEPRADDAYASVGAFSFPLTLAAEPPEPTRLPALSEVTVDTPPCSTFDPRATRVEVPATPAHRTFSVQRGKGVEPFVMEWTVAQAGGGGAVCAAANMARARRERATERVLLVGAGRAWYFGEKITPLTCVAR